jgi:LPXTG-motif cell wall-anchored protein
VSIPNWQIWDIPAGGQLDVQVQALIGHDNKHDWGMGLFGELISYYFEGEASGWSNTQSLTMPNSNPIGLDWEQTAIFLFGIAIILLAAAVVFLRKRNSK